MELIAQKLGKLNSMMKCRSVLSFLVVFFVSIISLKAQTVTTCSIVNFSGETGWILGETYTWSIGTVGAGISGQTPETVGKTTIDQTLINTGTSNAIITYNVTPSQGANFVLTVTVKPTPILTNTISPVCNFLNQNYNPTTNLVGTIITWTRPTISGISNLATTGTSSAVTEALINTTIAPIPVPYTFSMFNFGSGCSNVQTINSIVNPTPTLSNSINNNNPPAICSGDFFNLPVVTATNNTTIRWSRGNFANILNLPNSGVGDPNEPLFNNGNTVVTVTYSFLITINDGSNCSNPQNVDVLVKPKASIGPQTITPPICGTGSFILNPSGAPAGTQYDWTVLPTFSQSVNGATLGPQLNSISQTLTNTSTSVATGTYIITPSTNGCVGTPFNVDVTINPGLGLQIPAQPTFSECNNTQFKIPINGPAGASYTWSAPSGTLLGGVAQSTPQPDLNGLLVNNTTAPATATYDVVPQLNGCTGSIFQVQVLIDNPAILSNSLTPPAICSGQTFFYPPASTTRNTIFNWDRFINPDISTSPKNGVYNPNEVLVSTSTIPVKVDYIYTLLTGTCTNKQTVSVIVNPIPVLNSNLPNPICSGTTFNYNPLSATPGTAFTWTRPVVPFIGNTAFTGVGDPNMMLVNTSINPVMVPFDYTLVANGCNNLQTVNVIVNPIPIISDQSAFICSGSTFNITTLPPVPTGTQYTWTIPLSNPTNAILNGVASVGSQSLITGTLNNNTPNPASVKYIITPTAFITPTSPGCPGSTFSLSVDVTAPTALTTSLTPPTICSGQPFNYAPSTNTLGTIIGWTRGPVPGILEAATSGTGNPMEVLTNNTAGIVPVPYLFTLTTPTGCVSRQTVIAKVYPAPVLSSNLVAAAICTGTVFNYPPILLSNLATYSWFRPAIPGISNAPGSGTDPNYPLEQLDNVTGTPITVSYNFTIDISGCTNTQTVTVIVNPKPVVTPQTAITCSNVLFSVIPTGVGIIPGTQYLWTLPTSNGNVISGGSAESLVLQDNISQLLGNPSLNNAIATYTVTPYAYGCSGSNFTLDVTVRPAPVVANQTIAAVCSNTAFSYPAGATSVPVGTTYTWSNPLVAPANSLSGGSAQAFNQNIVSQTLTSINNLVNTAIYTVTPASAGCIGNTFTLTVPVKPVPFVNSLFDTICSGSLFSVSPSPVPFNTTYTWSNPTSIPFGRVVGGFGKNVPVNAISQSPVNTGGVPAQLLYSVTPVTNGCTGNPFTLLETVGVQLPAIANTTATVCSGVPFDATPTGVPVNTKYTWTVQSINPVGTISGTKAQTTAQPRVSDTIANLSGATATAVYTVTPVNTGCVGTIFLATINLRAVPKATIMQPPGPVCAYINDTLTISFAGTGPWSINYLDNGVAKTQIGITSNPYTWIVPSTPLATTKSLVITRVNDFACVDSVSNSSINQMFNPLPLGHIINLHGQYICNNTLDTLFIGHTIDTLSFQWTLNGMPMPNMNTDSISTLIPGNYNAYFTNRYGCTDTAAVPATLTYIAQPVIKFSYDNSCINYLISFKNLTDTTYIGPTRWSWDLGDSTTRARIDAANTYPYGGHRTIKLTAFQLNCPAYTTSLDTVINIGYPIPGLRMPSVTAYLGQNTPISARSIPNYKYLWTPTWGIDQPDSSSINFNYQHTQEYLVNLIAPSGCITYDTVLVRVYDNNLVNILVPKSFTPNGDGINDKLFPYLTGIKTFQYYKVYNRFGKLMFETRNYDEGWDGTVGGTPQPMAIYIWAAAGIGTDGTLVEKRGETLLLR